jgi:hypothetical protein
MRLKQKQNPSTPSGNGNAGDITICDGTHSDSQGIELSNDVVLEKYKHNPDSKIEHDGKM